MKDNVYWILELNINAGQLDQFRELMNEMTLATQNDEVGCLNYEWWLNEDETACHIYERYVDSAATMVHLGNFGSKFAERFMTHVSATGFKVYGNPTEDVKTALAGFGPIYMHSFGGFSR